MNILAFSTALSVAPEKPDYIALALVAAIAVFVVIMVIRKHIILKKSAKATPAEAPTAEEITEISVSPSHASAPGSAGKVKLHDVDPKTAAMLMAIVANKTGKQLNEIRFISIKEIK